MIPGVPSCGRLHHPGSIPSANRKAGRPVGAGYRRHVPRDERDDPDDPEDVEDVEDRPEVDPRFLLANERTFLAYIRTALALLAGGLAVVQFVEPLQVPYARRAVGIPLVALAALVAGVSLRRWESSARALRQGRPLPTSPLPRLLAVGVGLTALAAVVLAGVGAVRGP